MFRARAAPLCQLCGKGSYADSFGSAECRPCPGGGHTLSLGSRSSAQCRHTSGGRFSGKL